MLSFCRTSILPDNVTDVVCSVVVTVFDIPSDCNPSQSLGSVSFADSFVSSVVQVEYRGQSEDDGNELKSSLILFGDMLYCLGK